MTQLPPFSGNIFIFSSLLRDQTSAYRNCSSGKDFRPRGSSVPLGEVSACFARVKPLQILRSVKKEQNRQAPAPQVCPKHLTYSNCPIAQHQMPLHLRRTEHSHFFFFSQRSGIEAWEHHTNNWPQSVDENPRCLLSFSLPVPCMDIQ